MTETLYLVAKAFNANVKAGDLVAYSEVLGEGFPTIHELHGPAEVLNGHTVVVWLHRKTGCVAASHCRRLPIDFLSSENVQTILFEGHVDIESATLAMQDEYGCEFPAPTHGWMRYVDVPAGEDAEWWRVPCAQTDDGAEPVTYSQRLY